MGEKNAGGIKKIVEGTLEKRSIGGKKRWRMGGNDNKDV